MGQLLLLLIAELIGLYFLSQRLTRRLYLTLLLLFRHRSVAVSLMTALLFPGTVIHELSHLFTAEILGVKTGRLTLAPDLPCRLPAGRQGRQDQLNEKDVSVGSVELVETDPFRRSVIGLAPFFIGLVALFLLLSQLPALWQNTLTAYNQGILFSSPSSYLLLLTSYLLFCISNTMFASPEDMRGVIPFVAVLGILGALGYMAGFRVGITGVLEENVIAVMSAISKSLSVVLILNLSLYLLTSLAIRIEKRI